MNRSEVAEAMSLDVRYSQVWEDHRLLEEALRIGPGHEVLTVGSAGCNMLALLLREPASITSVDFSGAQIALQELKLKAIEALSSSDMLAVLGAGIDEPERRVATYGALRPQLSENARAFWDQHRPELAAGVIHMGRLDRYFRQFWREHQDEVAPPEVHRKLLGASDLQEQRRMASELFTPNFEELFRSYFGAERLAARGRSEAQMRYVDLEDVGAFNLERFRWVCHHLPANDNHYLEYFLTGGYENLDFGPPYLRPAHHRELRERVGRVTLVQEELSSFLHTAGSGAYDAVNLSDVCEYMSQKETDQLFEHVARVLRPGGRACLWNLYVPREPSEHLQIPLKPLRELSERLHASGRAWFYRAFHVWERT